ncbi:MAG: 50S ribosomal protein L11 methyltransferase [Desulfobacterales bacterium]|jgi:ribosomal protein L11 methyltransferase|nr:50S ribosomal protein L11 methyltransferase [Desulfobacterales bacterium]
MKWIEAKALFRSSDRRLATEILASAYYDAGIKGVVIEGPDEAPVEGWAPDIPEPSKPDAVIGYIPQNDTTVEICRDLENRLSRIGACHDIAIEIRYKDLDKEDWAESWKAFFWPSKISRRIVVKPTWRDYSPQPGEIIILLDPGMAFGTGTHPTTSLCVHLIETYLKEGDSFLDIGTGSGLLLIAAAKLGAAHALGIDNDAVAVTVANENIERNGLDRNLFHAASGDLANGLANRFSLVAANILSEVILVLLDHLSRVILPGGIFICSGIIEKNGPAVVDKMKRIGFEILTEQRQEGWVAIAGKYNRVTE